MIREILTWLAGSLDRESGLHTPDQFRALLDSERMRIDRGAGSLALLVLDLDRLADTGLSGGQLVMESLVDVLRQRLRGSDHVGMLDQNQLGIILTETGQSGAEKVVRDLVQSTPNINFSHCCEVFIYPPHDSDRDDDSDDSQPRGGSRRVAAERFRNGGRVQEDATVESPQLQSQSLQVLFVRPLPRWKRAIDLVGACLGIVFAAPVILVAALAVKLTSRGPVFFSQYRTGLGGRVFKIYKLRTMCHDAENRRNELLERNEQDGAAFKIKNDPRITPLGRFLRKTCIDELPQLWNVLVGDMSLVGPRPLPTHESDSCQDWERRRLEVTPGLTCTWQVLKDRCSFRDWMRMDIRYMKARSIVQDIKLMFKTFIKVFVYRTSH